MERIDAAGKISRDLAAARRLLGVWLACARDLVLLHGSGLAHLVNVDEVERLEPLAASLSMAQAWGLVAAVQETAQQIAENVNPRLAVEGAHPPPALPAGSGARLVEKERYSMPLVIGVRFHPATKIYFFDAAGFEDLQSGESVVVETARGEEIGRAIVAPHEVTDAEIISRLRPVLRRATPADLSLMDHYRQRSKRPSKSAAPGSRSETSHEAGPGRIQLQRAPPGLFLHLRETRGLSGAGQDLARLFPGAHRAAAGGVRDEAKLLGGIGKCGLALCCSTWLPDFHPVSIKMAKQQDLPPAPWRSWRLRPPPLLPRL